jgi:hypothetical protein
MECPAAARCLGSAAPELRGQPARVRLSRSVFALARTGVQAVSAYLAIGRSNEPSETMFWVPALDLPRQ